MSYWQKRQAELMYQQMDVAEMAADEIARIYEKASNKLNYEITSVYKRYVSKHNLSEAEAKKLLRKVKNKTDIEELKRMILRDPKNKDFIAELEAPAYKARIRRLEAIQEELDISMREIYNQEKTVHVKNYTGIYSESYYRAIHGIQEELGFQFSFQHVNEDMLNKALATKWSGANYSSRIWNNTRNLGSEIKEQMILGLLTGKRENEMAKELSKKYATGSFNSRRLIRTESNFFFGQAQMDAYHECECDKYEYVAVLDLRTSKVCRELDGQVFDVDKAEIGVNMHPMHPFCRSTTIAYLGDEEIEELERRARDPITGKNELIPADQNYKSWYEKNVANNPKALVEEKKIKNSLADKKQYERYMKTIGSSAGESFEAFQDIKYGDKLEYGILKAQSKGMSYYNAALRNEPAITNHIKDMAKELDLEVSGIEYRIKEKDSYLRKIRSKYDPVGNEYEIKDIIRYTYTGDSTKIASKTLGSIELNQNMGYNTIEVKNSWIDKMNPYNGINTTIQAPNGQKFELQYHTPESFTLKNGKMHDLYEKQRLIKDETSKEYIQLTEEMFELSDTLTVPEGIDGVK